MNTSMAKINPNNNTHDDLKIKYIREGYGNLKLKCNGNFVYR